jgi:hypothetical protein
MFLTILLNNGASSASAEKVLLVVRVDGKGMGVTRITKECR